MDQSGSLVNCSSPERKRNPTHGSDGNSTSRKINEGPKRRAATKDRYHPYQRNREYHNNDRQSKHRDKNNRQYFTFTRLKKLSDMNSDDCVAELAGKKDQFNELLNDSLRPDLLVLIVKVLTNICRANFTEILTGVLSHACSATFLKSLESYLTKLPFESDDNKLSNELYWENIDGFWNNLIILVKKMIELLPSKARDELVNVLGKTNTIMKTIEASQNYKIEDNVKDAILKMYDELKEEIVKFEDRNKVVQETINNLEKTQGPPENFRSLSVIPTIQDLRDNNPFIRPCKLEGAYDSVEHYLDVQFRLLREDFIAPLRDGIKEYLHGSKKYRNTQLRVYKKVKLESPETISNCLNVIVSFGILKNVKWNHSKRFLFGGLLCLSKDDFHSILFATVADRGEKLLQQGKLLIAPCEDTVITKDFYQFDWVMLESKIYFEPYFVVLNAMRNMREENFPMKKYLVDGETSTSLPPYLKADAILKYKDHSLPMEKDQTWPSSEMLHLDETQYAAFKSALSEELSVIQGPPGTGKTFIALEIIRTLLENRSYWRRAGPIVIVCLTNHALDQFLEGILKYTHSIVRVGRRSKSEALEKYMLAERRKLLPTIKKHERSSTVNTMNYEKYIAASVLHSIQRTRLIMKYLTTKDAVVPLRLLIEYCCDKRLMEFRNHDDLLQWLLTNGRSLHIDNLHQGPDEDWYSDGGESDFDPDGSEKPIFLLQDIDLKIAMIQALLDKNGRRASRIQGYQWRNSLHNLKLQRNTLQHNLAQHPLLTSEQKNKSPSPCWQIYWDWVKTSHEHAVRKLKRLEESYRQTALKLDEAKQLVDLELLKQYDIVGFTTTSAARLHASLRALHAPIVLVEEAAEILESHVVCSLTENCQHVILIGDHKQLRPKAAVHKLGTKYNLNVSLFERMVNIRGSCTQLAHQHRMRPEIARLICPAIYETLHNHPSVTQYPSIKGLEKNVFFINHKNRECSVDNQDTWTNPYEAKFLIAFARHLILQGYKSTEITILCTYTGQLFTLTKERNHYPILKQVRITTIDNYQGEENRIILLSLVRNNEEGNIGFLKEENRVCVALSRAREGLYIMGNMENLIIKNDVWPKIKTVLESTDAIGDSLELHCRFHPEKLIIVKEVSDFEQCPEGGCLQKCNTDMPCGHVCTSICHIPDREHINSTCKQPCVKNCPDDHPCPLLCHQGCNPCNVAVDRQLKCGHTVQIPCGLNRDEYQCHVEVEGVLPDCMHVVKKACYLSLRECDCSHPCETRLPCGHSCEINCHMSIDPDHIEYICRKPCSKRNKDCTMDHPCKLQCHENCQQCPIVVMKKLTCGHERTVKCSADVEKVICYKMMSHERSCGHKMTLRCFRKDDHCEEEVTKTGPCGHKILLKCHEKPSLSKCPKNCKRILNCGHPCTARCRDACTKKCVVPIPTVKPGLCGHIISVPCYLKEIDPESPALLEYCNKPCKTELVCGHICKGNCGSCRQGRIHKPCGEKCGNILVCGHECDVPCRQQCPPCQKPCPVKCRHSKCNKKCGELCTPCKEPCAAECRHSRCMKRCHQLCVREPCTKWCYKLIKCGHKCVGFCGEPCPQLCRICDKRKLVEEFFLGYEDEPDARFVLLEDCGHCIESRGLLKWVSERSASIQAKMCPRCKTPISKCMRILNYIKTDLKDIELVKTKIFGDAERLKVRQSKLDGKIKEMENSPVVVVSKGLQSFLINLKEDVATVTTRMRRQILDVQAVEAIEIVLDLLQEICDKYEKIKSYQVRSRKCVEEQIAMIVKSLPRRRQISNQEFQDIRRELQRLHYMTEVCIMETEACLKYSENSADQEQYDSIMKKLQFIGKFSESMEEKVVQDLNDFRALHHLNVVSNNERKMIVKVMGFKQGHWYKCPRGHIYSIGECGGAMQRSKCNECGAAIGGRSHRLVSDNSVASEMDGATHSAWLGQR